MAMRRDLSRLADTRFDLLVIGAGIHGACIAWDACLRGLSVAVVDQGDFGAATSASSLGIIHGGLRYLGRGDLVRMGQSSRERSVLLRIAPRLVEPLPVLVPIYQGSTTGRAAFGIALALNDLLSSRRNRGLDPERAIPRGQLISREECLRHFPEFPAAGLTGGALWYDAQVGQAERLTLSFLRSAATRGCVAANHVRVIGLRLQGGTVAGAALSDRLSGRELEIRAGAVVVAAGPWTQQLVAASAPQAKTSGVRRRAFAMNLVLGRRLAKVAVGVKARTDSAQDPVGGGHRFLFAVPHGRGTLVGTWYALVGENEARAATELGIRTLLAELNAACPGLDLSPADVVRSQSGWLPLKEGVESGRATALAERPVIVDHGTRHQIGHLLSVEGVKYTTARSVAERVVDQLFKSWGRPSPSCRTSQVPLEALPGGSALQPDGTVARAEILRAVREEMAVKLEDVVFRRSPLDPSDRPDRSVLEDIARVAGSELGWSAAHQETEVDEVMRRFGVTGLAMEAVG